MSDVYLYCFGFELPEERRSNEEHGTDFETAKYFRIRAHSEKDALEWGHILARWFVNKLYGTGQDEWSPEHFATWIEYSPREMLANAAAKLPIVDEGEYPDFNRVKEAFKC